MLSAPKLAILTPKVFASSKSVFAMYRVGLFLSLQMVGGQVRAGRSGRTVWKPAHGHICTPSPTYLHTCAAHGAPTVAHASGVAGLGHGRMLYCARLWLGIGGFKGSDRSAIVSHYILLRPDCS